MHDDQVQEWESDFAGYAGPLPELLERLEQRLQERPKLAELAATVVARRLDEGVDRDTMIQIGNGLDDLTLNLGDALIVWASRRGGALITDLEAERSIPQLADLLRRLLAEHGPRLAAAANVINAPPDDWRFFRREVCLDVENSVYVIVTELEKFNGEMLRIRGDQNSLLGLTRNLLTSLRLIPDPKSFEADQKDEFLAEVSALTEAWNAEDAADAVMPAATPAAMPEPGPEPMTS